ncbi:hypothetical protein D9M71_623560 [compost metagenome]
MLCIFSQSPARCRRYLVIQQVKAQRAGKDAKADHPTCRPFTQPHRLRGIEPGNDQRERRGREHHARAKTHEAIGHRHRHAANDQHRYCAQGGAKGTDCAAFQCSHQPGLQPQPRQPLGRQQGTAAEQQHNAQCQAKQANTLNGHCLCAHDGGLRPGLRGNVVPLRTNRSRCRKR